MMLRAANQRVRVAAQAVSWLATPYHHHGRVKGVGVDCANLLCAVYHEAGVIGNIDPGFYPHDWHLHHNDELFIQWVERTGAHSVEKPMTGDVALFRFGRTFSHGAVMISAETIVHAYLEMGVILSRLDEHPVAGRAVQFWSLWK